MSKKICIVSSGQPSANPRLTKEAITLSSLGYEVAVIYCPISLWADKYDIDLFQRYPDISWIKAGYHQRKQPFAYYLARLRRIFFNYLYVLSKQWDIPIKSIVLFNQELTSAALKLKADIYIGHNLGALPVVVKAAQYHRKKCIFDFEDFHRGEVDSNSSHANKVISIENKYVPLLSFCTASSPLIVKEYARYFPSAKFATIQNCFSVAYQKKKLPGLADKPLKLFWFSQYVGKNRGIEAILQGMSATKNENIAITLLGNCSDDLKDYFKKFALLQGLQEKQLIFHDTVSEDVIVDIASHHHVGLSAEVPHILNRELCLTNKIFMYLLAGNAIMFSKTSAHEYFLDANPDVGVLYDPKNVQQIAAILQHYATNKILLEHHRNNSFQLGKTKLNWESESIYLKKYITAVLE